MPEKPQSSVRAKCFLSLPYAFETVREALEQVVREVGGEAGYVVAPEGDTLRSEIRRGIDSSSILIADLSSAEPLEPELTTKGPRPAVMWEIGYATALGLPSILICQIKDKAFMPKILAEHHTTYYDMNKLPAMVKEVRRTLEKVVARGPAHRPTTFRSQCYIDRHSADLDVRYLKATKSIKILELNLETVVNQVPMITAALRINPELSVQILTLNPFSRWAADRATQLAQLPLAYRKALYTAIKRTHEGLSAIPSDRWALHIYDTFPTQIMFQVDHALIHSMIALGTRSRDMLHFEIHNEQPNAYGTFEAHFAQLWNSSVEYSEWYKRNEIQVLELLGQERAEVKDETKPTAHVRRASRRKSDRASRVSSKAKKKVKSRRKHNAG